MNNNISITYLANVFIIIIFFIIARINEKSNVSKKNSSPATNRIRVRTKIIKEKPKTL